MGTDAPAETPEAAGLDPKRIKFARWLLAQGRISDEIKLTTESVSAAWPDILTRVKRDSPIIAALLRDAEITEADGTDVTVRVRHKVRHEKLIEHQVNASALVMKAMGQPVTLHLLPPIHQT